MNSQSFFCNVESQDYLTVTQMRSGDFWIGVEMTHAADPNGVQLSTDDIRGLITFLEGCLQDATEPVAAPHGAQSGA